MTVVVWQNKPKCDRSPCENLHENGVKRDAM